MIEITDLTNYQTKRDVILNKAKITIRLKRLKIREIKRTGER